jgi:transcriptional regulator with XRE-family HTH domain
MRGGAFAIRFGRNLAYCRNRAGDLSQEELGMRSELHRTAVGQLERGERVARSDTLVKLAGSLGIPTTNCSTAWSGRRYGGAPMKPRYEVAVGFGANLRRCRRRTGLSQEGLSFRASVHRVAVGKMERGETLPRTDTLLRLAGGLGVPPQELLEGLAWTPPPAPSWGSFRVASPLSSDSGDGARDGLATA